MKYKTSKTLIAVVVSQLVLFGCKGDGNGQPQKNIEKQVVSFEKLHQDAEAAGQALHATLAKHEIDVAHVAEVETRQEGIKNLCIQISAMCEYTDSLWNDMVLSHLHTNFVKKDSEIEKEKLDALEKAITESDKTVKEQRKKLDEAKVNDLPSTGWVKSTTSSALHNVMKDKVDQASLSYIDEHNRTTKPLLEGLEAYETALNALKAAPNADKAKVKALSESFEEDYQLAQRLQNVIAYVNKVEMVSQCETIKNHQGLDGSAVFFKAVLQKAKAFGLSETTQKAIEAKKEEAKKEEDEK